MSEGFYAGWGTRDAITQAFKKVLKAQAQTSTRRSLVADLKAVSRVRAAYHLDQAETYVALAGLIAEGVMRRFLNDEGQYESRFIQSLPYYDHLQQVIAGVLAYERPFALPDAQAIRRGSSTAELWENEERIKLVAKRLNSFALFCENYELVFALISQPILDQAPMAFAGPLETGGKFYQTRLIDMLTALPEIVETALQTVFVPELEEFEQTARLQDRLMHNIAVASGLHPQEQPTFKNAKLPTRNSTVRGAELLSVYLAGTPLEELFDYEVAMPLPKEVRFEHHHIVAGSGHGKTQTLQDLIAHDLPQVHAGEASVVVIDSQGDLIDKISHLPAFAEGGALADRLVLIDPTDVEYPVALNLFDIGMERINRYSQLDRERMINGVLELYDFVLGSLLDAQMTQKQTVIFRYITRLMLHIPNATIITLRELLEDGGSARYRPYIETLEGSARGFFETEFDSREFSQTKRQVLRRLWGILENQSFERMFLHPRNKLDLFSELNSGKIILINTAKDLLKEEGTQIFGRFFIAMIAQAAQERSVIPESERIPTFVYIDEAQDYFDRNVGIILSQARKYKVGMILAHQFLGQLDSKLQESVFANTSIKFAGGVSAKDARALASEMRTSAEFIEQQNTLEFAAYIRGTTRTAISIKVEPGVLERQQRMSVDAYAGLRDRMRDRYAVHYQTLRQTNAKAAPEDATQQPTTGPATPPATATTKAADDTQSNEPAVPKSDRPSLSDDAAAWD